MNYMGNPQQFTANKLSCRHIILFHETSTKFPVLRKLLLEKATYEKNVKYVYLFAYIYTYTQIYNIYTYIYNIYIYIYIIIIYIYIYIIYTYIYIIYYIYIYYIYIYICT